MTGMMTVKGRASGIAETAGATCETGLLFVAATAYRAAPLFAGDDHAGNYSPTSVDEHVRVAGNRRSERLFRAAAQLRDPRDPVA
jgi:hypothetical protein